MERADLEFSPQSGRCLCGAARYALKAPPFTSYACHCTECQRASGSGYSMTTIAAADGLDLTAGELIERGFTLRDSRRCSHACSVCGTVLWYSSPSHPEILAVKSGTFDTPDVFPPVAHLWVRSKQSATGLPAHERQYQEQPELGELLELWQHRQAK